MANIFIRGDTFAFVCPSAGIVVDGVAVDDYTGWTGASQIRSSNGTLIADLTFTWIDLSTGQFTIIYAGSTQDWGVGEIYIDVEFTSPGGTIVSTRKAVFSVVGDVTRST